MIGVKFRIENEYGNILSKILKNIDFIDYKWEIVESEVYDKLGNHFFCDYTYKNNDFKSIIESGYYYPVFVHIELYLNNDRCEDIENYNQFLDSKCQLVLFITDNIFVDVYSKDKDILNTIYKNVVSNNFTNIEKIIDKCDVRKTFSAYSD